MGTFIGNFHVRTADQAALEAALDTLGARSRRVTPGGGGWISVYEERCSLQDEERIVELTQGLSSTLQTAAVGFLVHDSDLFRYWLFARGESVDSYDSWPDYGESDDEPEAEGGDSEALLPFCVAGTTADAIDLALADEPTFAEDKLEALATFLGIDGERARDDFRADAVASGAVSERLMEQLEQALGNQPETTAGGTEIVRAASKGDLSAIRACLARGESVDALGKAPLPSAGLDIPGLKLPEITMTALHAAILSRNEEAVALLLGAGAQVDRDVPPQLGPALHTAAGVGVPGIVRRLLAAGADARAKRPTGTTALDELRTTRQMLSAMDAMRAMLPEAVQKSLPSPAAFDACEALLVEAMK